MTEQETEGAGMPPEIDAGQETGDTQPHEITVETQGAEAMLAEKEAELQALQDRILRQAAEFDNYRKRISRESEDFRKYALDGLVRDLLPVVDNLERAIAHAAENPEGSVQGLITGVEMTLKQFKGVLQKNGVTEISSLGEVFNPSCHEAVAQVETDEHENNRVIMEFQKGYYLADRVLRPAMVSVAKRTERKNTETGADNA